MERNSKRKRLDKEESGNPEINTVKNVGTKSSSFCLSASSNNDDDSACTSPVLDTSNIRRKGKSWTRRAVSDSAYSPRRTRLGDLKEIHQIPGTSGSDKNLEKSMKSENLTKCPSCNWVLNSDQQCHNCSDANLAAGKSKCHSKNLAERLRDLRRHKKSATRISDLRDAQITDEEFVESVRMLDKVCCPAPPARAVVSPKKSLGLLQLQTKKNFSPVSRMMLDEDNDDDEPAKILESPKKNLGPLPSFDVERLRLSQLQTRKKFSPVSHLTLDEDNDEDEDMFEDAKDDAEAAEDLDEFSQWRYTGKPADTTAPSISSFYGFSPEEYNRSRDLAERGSQLQQLSELGGKKNACFRGFASADIDTSERLSQNWKSALRTDYPDSEEWDDWFVGELEPVNRRILTNIQDKQDGRASSQARGNSESFDNSAKRPATSEIISENQPGNRETVSKDMGKVNSGFATAGGRQLQISQDSWAKSKALFDSVEEPPVEEFAETRTSPAALKKNEGQVNTGFATAGGRELKISQDSWAKSKALFDAIEEPPVEEFAETKTDPAPMKENEVKINSGFATAGGRELKISQDSWAKSKALFDAIKEPPIEEFAETKTDPAPMKENEVKINSGFATAGGRELKISQDSWAKSKALFDAIEEPPVEEFAETKTDPATMKKNEVKINSGFATAGGRELKISEDSWAKSKAIFDSIEEPSIAEIENKKETMPSGFSTASGRSIVVSTDAVSAAEAQLSADLDNMESLDFEDFVDAVEEPEASSKRKFEEIEEETPLRRESSLKRKRGRYVNDLQGRKLFDEDSNTDEELHEPRRTSEFVESKIIGHEKNLISDEVDASAAALLVDVERSNEGTTWQINAECREGSISPELGCEIGNRSRADVSTRNQLGIHNRAELEKVNVVGVTGREPRYSRPTSGSSTETKGNNDRAATAEKREEPQEIQQESIPDDLTFDSQFSQDIQHSPVIDRFIADTMKIMEGRLTAALKQDEAIRGKRRTKLEPSDGRLYRLRSSNRDSRISWKELTEGNASAPRETCGDSFGRDLLSVTADSAARYGFRCADFYGDRIVRRNIDGIKVGDEAFLILDEKNCAGVREFERAFLASPGVDPNLVPTGWVKNHYRWIVWKLASMDRVNFGHKCLPRMLTPDRVMLELKYRYDREIYRMQWPPLRRILERSENASARLVLCVSSIIAAEKENAPVKGAHTPSSLASAMYKMEVTDGWYSIGTSIDAAMVSFIKSGKVREGTKLMIFGAKAVNLDQGCSALEIPEAVTLRIYSNSTRRARWDTKLDYYRANRGPMSLGLRTVKPNGGAICKMVVAVSRVYPILYREKLPDGQFVFRNARSDEEAARAHEARYQSKMEEIYASAWNEFQIGSMSRKGSGARKRSYTQEEVAACGRDLEEELRQRISSKMSECLPTPRDVTPVMKLRIAEEDTSALVTVWSTDRDTTELFVEGSSIVIYNSFASGLRSNELQITAGRSTFVKRELSRRISYPERIYTSLAGITEAGFNPVYGEFDTIGVVSSIGPAPHGMKNFETVNLACPRPGDTTASDFLSILFWQSVSTHGYSKILTVGSLVACSNLEWRRNTSRSIPTAFCTDRSVFSKNPRQNHLIQFFETLRDDIKEPLAYAASCATVIEEEIAKKSALRTPGRGCTPYRPGTSNSRTPGWSPRDLTCAIDANCSTPRNNSRKTTTTTRERLERLEAYGEPPKLPSIVINNSSHKVLSDFRSPVRTPDTKS